MKNSRSDSRNGSFGRTETSGNNDTNITNNSLTKKKLERSYSPSSRSSSSSSSPVPNPSSSRNSPSTSISQKSSPLSKSSSISKNLPNSSLSHSTSFPQNPDVLFSKQLSSPVLKNVDEFREISNEKPSTSFDQRPSLKGRANSFEFVSKKEADAQKRKMQENNAYQTLRKKYEELIEKGNKDSGPKEKILDEIKKLILVEGLPPETQEEKNTASQKATLRCKVWKILLEVPTIDSTTYINYIKKGVPDDYSKYESIRKDVPRTFMHDGEFSKRVPQDKLTRLLCAALHSFDEYGFSNENKKLTYVQGLNIPAGIFLYVMPELDAFFSFLRFVRTCPLYWTKDIEGAHNGLQLLDEVLKVVDDELYQHFMSQEPPLVSASYGMQYILSLSGCTPPLEEVLKIWDYLLAFGTHLNIPCVVAQIMLNRQEYLSQSKGINLRTLPPVNACAVISLANFIVRQLSDDLYSSLSTHHQKSLKGSSVKYATLPRNFSMRKESLRSLITMRTGSKEELKKSMRDLNSHGHESKKENKEDRN